MKIDRPRIMYGEKQPLQNMETPRESGDEEGRELHGVGQ